MGYFNTSDIVIGVGVVDCMAVACFFHDPNMALVLEDMGLQNSNNMTFECRGKIDMFARLLNVKCVAIKKSSNMTLDTIGKAAWKLYGQQIYPKRNVIVKIDGNETSLYLIDKLKQEAIIGGENSIPEIMLARVMAQVYIDGQDKESTNANR